MNTLPKYNVLTSPPERLLPSRITLGVLHQILSGWCHQDVRAAYAAASGHAEAYPAPSLMDDGKDGGPYRVGDLLTPLCGKITGDDSPIFRGWSLTTRNLLSGERDGHRPADDVTADGIIDIIRHERNLWSVAVDRADASDVPLAGFVVAGASLVRERGFDRQHPAVLAWAKAAWCRRPELMTKGFPPEDLSILIDGDDGSFDRAVRRELAARQLGAGNWSWRWYGTDLKTRIAHGHWLKFGVGDDELHVVGQLVAHAPHLRDRIRDLTVLPMKDKDRMNFLSAISAT